MEDEVLTPATLTKYVKNGADIKIRADESQFIRKLDAQSDKAIYGGGFLISKAAAEKEKTRWELSKREQEIVERLGE